MKTKREKKNIPPRAVNLMAHEHNNAESPDKQAKEKSQLEITQRVLDLLSGRKIPLQWDDIVCEVDCTQAALHECLDGMIRDGALMMTKRRCYGLPSQLGCVTGTLKATNGSAAFIVQELGDDYFVPMDGRSGSMHNDRVLARVIKPAQGERRGEAEVLNVLKRANDRIVGVYRRMAGGGIVTSDERKLGGIFIPQGCERGAWEGSKVVVDITRYPDERRDLEGKVTEVLGDQGETEAEILSIIRALGIRDTFPPQVRAEADAVAGCALEVSGNRLDLRHELIVTIDGADAKDLDDAVSIESSAQRALEARRAHRGCVALCEQRRGHRQRGMEARHQRLPAQHRDTHAARAAIQRSVFAAPRRGPLHTVLHHGAGQPRRAGEQ